jgi:uracil-DNA glycosylase family protein
MRKTLLNGVADSAAEFVPATGSLRTLASAAQACRGCPLFANATQAVFGQGPKGASVLMVGEQPGDAEDLAGEPFVGPAGRLLDQVLEEVGIDRGQVYVTNAVKHFKWTPRGKRRMHAKPSAREVSACRPWLVAELELIKPEVLVCLGATAAQSLLGRTFRLTQSRGQAFESDWAKWTLATYHPSAVLRAKQTDQSDEVMAAFTDDLRRVARLIHRRKPR